MIKINLMLYKIFKVNYIIQKQKVENAKETINIFQTGACYHDRKPNTVPDSLSCIF